MADKKDQKLLELEEELRKIKKKVRRQKWLNVYLIWSK
jgi:hypothetical protein